MATIEKTVEVIFAGRDDVSRVMRTISGNLDALSSTVEAVARPLARVADMILAVDAAMLGLAAGGLALSVKKAGEFNDAFAEISTLIDATGQDLEGFRSAILDYARTSTASIDDITGAIYTAISAGTDWKDSIRLVAEAERLATAGRADLEATTRLLVSALNAYGASTEEVTRYSDVFFQTVRDGQTTLPDLADKLAAVFGLAAAGGVDIETLAAAIATLTTAGFQTDQAVTALRGALSNLLKPSKEAEKVAQALGIEFGAQALEAKGLAGVLTDVAKATRGNAEEVAKLFPNVRALNGVLVLTSDDGLQRFRAEIENMRQAAGATSDAFEKMARNFDQVNQNLRNNLTATLAQIGQPLLDQYKDVAEAIAGISQALGAGIDAGALDPLFQALNDWAERLETFLEGVADALPEALRQVDFSGLIQSIEDFGATLSKMLSGIDLTTPEGLARAFQFLVDTMASLVTATEGIAEALAPVAERLVQLLDRINRMADDDLKRLAGNLLGKAKLIDEFGFWVGTALAALEGSWESSARSAEELGEVLDDTGLLLADTGDAAAKAAKVMRESSQAFDAVKDTTVTTNQVLAATKVSVEDLEKAFLEQVNAAEQASVAVQDLSGDFLGINQEILDAERSVAGFVQTEEGIWTQAPNVTGALKAMGDETRSLSGAMEKAGQDSEDFRLKMAAIKADFAKTALKLSVDLRVAQVQAQADQIKSIMSGLSTSFQSVTSAISQMTGQWAGLVGGNLSQWTASNQLWTLIQQQAQQQQQYTQAQIKLAQAQIQLLQARTQALQSGQALIQIDGTGLSPSLQMVMWEILEQVQLRVNQSAADLLMGI